MLSADGFMIAVLIINTIIVALIVWWGRAHR